jgi:hypothetical protein
MFKDIGGYKVVTWGFAGGDFCNLLKNRSRGEGASSS